jgi:hypothetical protein
MLCDPSGLGIMPAWMLAEPTIDPSDASTVSRTFVRSSNMASQ